MAHAGHDRFASEGTGDKKRHERKTDRPRVLDSRLPYPTPHTLNPLSPQPTRLSHRPLPRSRPHAQALPAPRDHHAAQHDAVGGARLRLERHGQHRHGAGHLVLRLGQRRQLADQAGGWTA